MCCNYIYTYIYIFPNILSYTTQYLSRLGNEFRLITSQYQTFSFKNNSIKTYNLSLEKDFSLYKVRYRNTFRKLLVKSRKKIYLQKYSTLVIYMFCVKYCIYNCSKRAWSGSKINVVCTQWSRSCRAQKSSIDANIHLGIWC